MVIISYQKHIINIQNQNYTIPLCKNVIVKVVVCVTFLKSMLMKKESMFKGVRLLIG
jgi:hypothetical protein